MDRHIAKLKNKTYLFRIFAVILASVLLAGLLTGCRREFTKKDVHKYIRETLELKKYRIIDSPEDKINPEDYRDEWWTVTTDEFGFDEPLTFHVINYMRWSGEWASNILTDDLEGQIFKKLAQDYAAESGIPYILTTDDVDAHSVREIIASSGKTDDNRPAIVQVDEYILYDGSFYYPLRTRSDFEAPLDEIARFQEYVGQYPKLAEKEFSLRYYVDSNLPNAGSKNSLGSTFAQPADTASGSDFDPAVETSNVYLDYAVPFHSETSFSDLHNALYSYGDYSYKNGAAYDYLADCLLYGFKDRIAEFTDQEIESLIQINSNLAPIRDVDEKELVPGAVYASNQNYIPLGHLYDLVQYQGIPVTGSWKHFSFTGKDGVFYELGYDLPPLDEDDIYGYSFQVTTEDAAKMLGLDLDTGYPAYDILIPKDAISDFGMDETILLEELEAAAEGDIRGILLEADGIHIKGKAIQFNRIEKANEERIREIEQELRSYDSGFSAYFNHLSKTYQGLRFKFTSTGIDLSAHEARFNEMILRTIINSLLDNPEDTDWFSKVEFEYEINGETEEDTFLLPDEMEAYKSYLRDDTSGISYEFDLDF